jgi:hypothetical protein
METWLTVSPLHRTKATNQEGTDASQACRRNHELATSASSNAVLNVRALPSATSYTGGQRSLQATTRQARKPGSLHSVPNAHTYKIMTKEVLNSHDLYRKIKVCRFGTIGPV